MPISRTAAWGWAAFVLLGTLFFSVMLPLAADRLSEVALPPGAVPFGNASIIPAEGWAVTDMTATSVTLAKDGVVAAFRSVSAEGESAALRAQDLATDTREKQPQLTVQSQARPFDTTSRTPGQLIALAGTSQTSLVASVVDGSQAVDVITIGESTQFGEAVTDIQNMLETIRIKSGAVDGG